MPGRGTPWRFEKGAKDRIGSADIKDDTITGADIKDLTITEADLDPAVTGKLNKTGGHTIQDEGTPLTQQSNMNFVGAGVVASVGGEDTTIVTIAGGGGGGGSLIPDTVPFTRYVLYEEFNNNDTTNLEVQYGEIAGNGQIGIVQTKQTGGIIEIGTSGTAGLGEGLGTVGANKTRHAMWTDPTKNAESKIRTALKSPLTNRLDFIGFMDETPAISGATSVALAEANFANGAYFRYDGAGNWQAVTMLTNTKTTTDTGVAPSGSQQDFEIIFTASQIVFKINGSTVATHTTNLPIVLIFLLNYTIDQTAVTHTQELDTWYVIGDR